MCIFQKKMLGRGGGGGKMFLFLAMSCLFLVLWMSFQPASPDSGPGTPVLRGVFIADGLMSRRGLEKQQDKKDNNEPGNSEAEEGAHTSCGHEHEWGVFFAQISRKQAERRSNARLRMKNLHHYVYTENS